MLNQKLVVDPNSVEELFCVPFESISCREMNDEETDLLFRLMRLEKGGYDAPEIKEEDLPFQMKLVKKSLQHRFSFNMSEPLQIFISVISKSAGNIIMYLTYLQYRAKKMDKQTLNLEDYAKIFTRGIPTDESLQDIWESQKVKTGHINPNGSDNLIDYPSAKKSI